MKLKNKILERIFRFDFLNEVKEKEEGSGPIQITFKDGSVFEIELASDGESLDFKWREKLEIAEEYKNTDWLQIDLTDSQPLSQLKNLRVIDYDELLFGMEEDVPEAMVVAGVGFRFENESSFVYYNAGDVPRIYVNESPPHYEPFKFIWKYGVFDDVI